MPNRGVDPSAARKKLIAESFYLPGWGAVRWDEATPKQLAEHAKIQKAKALSAELLSPKRRTKAQKDSDKHDAAIQEMEREWDDFYNRYHEATTFEQMILSTLVGGPDAR